MVKSFRIEIFGSIPKLPLKPPTYRNLMARFNSLYQYLDDSDALKVLTSEVIDLFDYFAVQHIQEKSIYNKSKELVNYDKLKKLRSKYLYQLKSKSPPKKSEFFTFKKRIDFHCQNQDFRVVNRADFEFYMSDHYYGKSKYVSKNPRYVANRIRLAEAAEAESKAKIKAEKLKLDNLVQVELIDSLSQEFSQTSVSDNYIPSSESKSKSVKSRIDWSDVLILLARFSLSFEGLQEFLRAIIGTLGLDLSLSVSDTTLWRQYQNLRLIH